MFCRTIWSLIPHLFLTTSVQKIWLSHDSCRAIWSLYQTLRFVWYLISISTGSQHRFCRSTQNPTLISITSLYFYLIFYMDTLFLLSVSQSHFCSLISLPHNLHTNLTAWCDLSMTFTKKKSDYRSSLHQVYKSSDLHAVFCIKSNLYSVLLWSSKIWSLCRGVWSPHLCKKILELEL